jgi:hypothetical protein
MLGHALRQLGKIAKRLGIESDRSDNRVVVEFDSVIVSYDTGTLGRRGTDCIVANGASIAPDYAVGF